MQKKIIFPILLILLLFSPFSFAGANPHWIHIIIRAHEPFWDLYAKNAILAGEQLGIKVTTSFGKQENDYIKHLADAEEILSKEKKPDIVLFNNFHNTAEKIIKSAQYNGVNAILINSDLSESSKKNVGTYPRAKYKRWIAQILPDDPGSSKMVTTKLIEAAKKKIPNLKLLFLNGPKEAGAAIGRGKGFQEALKQFPEIDAHKQVQQFNLNAWTAEAGKEKFRQVLSRSNINAVFCANGNIMLGVVEAAKEAEFTPNEDIFIAGMDIDDNIAGMLKRNELVATAGGHFTEGGFVTVLCYDFLNGKDFAEEGVSYNSPMIIATPQNIDSIKDFFSLDKTPPIDYSVFSKVKNPKRKKYDFNFDFSK